MILYSVKTQLQYLLLNKAKKIRFMKFNNASLFYPLTNLLYRTAGNSDIMVILV